MDASHEKKGRRKRRVVSEKTGENRCIYCQRLFSTEKGLTMHVRSCTNKSILESPNKSIMVNCPNCQREFKGEKGLKIHKLRSLCGRSISSEDNCNSESEALASQAKPHSAMPCQTSSKNLRFLKMISSKSEVLWPKMTEVEKWETFQKQVMSELTDIPMSIHKQINNLETVVHGVGLELFDTKIRRKREPNRREKLLAELRGELRNLRKAYLKAGEGSEEQIAIQDLQIHTRERLKAVRKAENNRKRRWRRRSLRAKFYRDPYSTAKEIIQPKVFCQLDVSLVELNSYLDDVCRDDLRDQDLGVLEGWEY